MLDWLKRLTGTMRTGSGNREDAAGLSSRHIEQIAEDLDFLGGYDRQVPARGIAYLVSGQDESVLGDLAGLPAGAGTAFGLACCGIAFTQDKRILQRHSLLLDLHGVDPIYHLRLARIYEAISRRDRKSLWLDWMPGVPAWLDVYMQEAFRTLYYVHLQKPFYQTFPADLFERMLSLDGADPSIMVKLALWQNPQGTGLYAKWFADRMEAMDTVARRYPDVIRTAISQGPSAQRARALGLLFKWKIDMEPFSAELVDAATDSAKSVREAARAMVAPMVKGVRPLLLHKMETGGPAERLHAVTLLAWLGTELPREVLQQRLESENSVKVKKAIQDLLSPPAAQPGEPTPAAFKIDLPPIPPVPMDVKVPADLAEQLRKIHTANYTKAMAGYQEAKVKGYNWTKPLSVGSDWFDWAAASIAEPQKLKAKANRCQGWSVAMDGVEAVAQRQDIDLVVLVRLLVALGVIRASQREPWRITWNGYALISAHFATHPHPMAMRYLAAVLKAHDIDDKVLGTDWLTGESALHEMDIEQVWPYFVERVGMLEACLGPKEDRDWRYNERRRHAFEVLSAMPFPPPNLVPLMWELALGSGKSERDAAQKSLRNAPDRDARIIQALESGQQDVRAAAAEWLAQLRVPAAAEPLKKALAKEKSEIAKAAMLSALEQMGEPIEEFIDRDGLAKEAKAGLARGIPPVLDWIQVELIPPVRWQDTGKPVDREVLAWLLIKACKVASPEPSPMLRRYAQWFVREDAERFGQWVLGSWIGRDVIPRPREEAITAARQHAQAVARYTKELTEEQIFQAVLPSYLQQPAGSAIKQKGVLAVAACCCGRAAAAPVEQYLKTWFGHRAHQCKALLQMLSWVEHPSAIQLVLSVANRFRTAGIRKEADAIAESLAQRKGWTRDELADRTIPTAGMDESGQLVLDTGVRQLTARLTADLQLVLTSPEGRPLKGFPAARQDEPEEQYKKARAAFSAAKKELAAVLRLQKDRLYEAMCTQRAWRAEDWDLYLHRHPIVGRHCQKLVWAAFQDEGLAASFRALDDGSLSSVEDDAVTLPAGGLVRVAHTCNLPAELVARWTAHLADYQVEPLFQQFDRPPYALDETARQETAVEEFKGHMIEAFKLRSAAQKLGYVRGPAEDAGMFRWYCKTFPTLGIEAVIEFSGNFLPEENRNVALISLHFARITGKDSSGQSVLVLGKVPAVLLSECYNDLSQIARLGTGIDPDWEKKV